jgi:hypothetical protein
MKLSRTTKAAAVALALNALALTATPSEADWVSPPPPGPDPCPGYGSTLFFVDSDNHICEFGNDECWQDRNSWMEKTFQYEDPECYYYFEHWGYNGCA